MASIVPMSRAGRSMLLLATLATGACALPHDHDQLPPWRPQEVGAPDDPQPMGRQVVVEAMAIPAAWLTRDGDGGVPNVDAEGGAGYGLRCALGSKAQSVGLLYQGFVSDGDVVDAQLLGFDLDVRAALEETGDAFFLRAGAGIGAAWLEDPVDGSHDTEATAQLRLGFDFEPTSHFLIGASFGGLVIGHAGDLKAYGTFLAFEASWIF